MKRLSTIVSALFLWLTFLPSYAQTLTNKIVIDQFGYRSSSEKVAVIRDPQTGFDASESFSPGTSYALVNAENDNPVFSGTATAWDNGNEDASSGDKTWWFDFSAYSTEGSYYILDQDNNVRSFEFEIKDNIFEDVLKHAVRTFYYQRAGFEKEAQYAGTGWADGASHIGPLQDTECRVYDDPNNSSTEMDVHGGWYDAGDLNKYTSWTAGYALTMLIAYQEKPDAWGDDYNIPESGNGIPDILDEAKFGLEHLLRCQKPDGSLISVIDESHASPPSSATGQSLYGTPNTSTALSCAGTFAKGADIFGDLGMTAFSASLEQAAIDAWDWAEANPNVIWRNNDEAYGSKGIASGQQEHDDYGRLSKKFRAAVLLYELTGDAEYKTFADNNYDEIHLMQWNFAYPFEPEQQMYLLYYANLPGVSTTISNDILDTYNTAMAKSENWQAFTNEVDPYMAHIKDYTWGSNNTKSKKGSMFYDLITYEVDPGTETDAEKAAERFIHYIHGVNPLNMTFLSNMYDYGGENCANEFFHTWFTNGSALWDRAGTSTYGPAPGFLTGGPNPGYDWDGCCPNSCGGAGNNAVCTSISINPPKGQPDQKSYLDFNDSWPLNSWSVTENSCGYQMSYIRLLSKFVTVAPILTSVEDNQRGTQIDLFPNPASSKLEINVNGLKASVYEVLDVTGRIVLSGEMTNSSSISISQLESGHYLLSVNCQGERITKAFVKE